MTLEREIREVLNRNSAESRSDTPDHILAHFLRHCLDAFDEGVTKRDAFLGGKAGEIASYRAMLEEERAPHPRPKSEESKSEQDASYREFVESVYDTLAVIVGEYRAQGRILPGYYKILNEYIRDFGPKRERQKLGR